MLDTKSAVEHREIYVIKQDARGVIGDWGNKSLFFKEGGTS